MDACASPLLRFTVRGRSRVRVALQSLLRRRRSLPLSKPRSPSEVLGSSSYRPTKSTLRTSRFRGKRLTVCPQLPARAFAFSCRAFVAAIRGLQKFFTRPSTACGRPRRRRDDAHSPPRERANQRTTPLSAIQSGAPRAAPSCAIAIARARLPRALARSAPASPRRVRPRAALLDARSRSDLLSVHAASHRQDSAERPASEEGWQRLRHSRGGRRHRLRRARAGSAANSAHHARRTVRRGRCSPRRRASASTSAPIRSSASASAAPRRATSIGGAGFMKG